MLTIDFETYYSRDYSLSKISTEDYVSDPNFQIILLGVKRDNAEPEWVSSYTKKDYRELLLDNGADREPVLAHNGMFDFLIMSERLGIRPPLMLDTMLMANAKVRPYTGRVSLAKCMEFYGVGAKGTEVLNALGKRLEDFAPGELQRYAEYCMNDCDGTYAVFRHMIKDGFPRDELRIVDMTLRMYLEPQLELDPDVWSALQRRAIQRQAELIRRLPDGVTQDQLASNVKFAELLRSYGVEPPLKISPRTGKPTFAFAKNDPEFAELVEEYEDDDNVAPILAARTGTKSRIEETRAQRMYGIAARYRKFRVPLGYYQAHTGRYGGMQKINPQNFKRINPKDPSRVQMRYGIKAPKGHVVLAADQSQIEARINAHSSGCKKLVRLFAEGEDVYSSFASEVYARPITKSTDPLERFIGKTCVLGLGYGMGASKLKATLRKDGVVVEEHEAERFVHTYRSTYFQIRDLWRRCDDAIEVMHSGGKVKIGPCVAEGDKVLLPNGMELVYPDLQWVDGDKYTGWVYSFGRTRRTLWGGKFVENMVQALARTVIMENMLAIRRELGLCPAMQVHDELVYVVREDEVEDINSEVLAIMRRPPEWAPDLPLDAESAWGPSYGDAK